MSIEQVIYIVGLTIGICIWVGLLIFQIHENRKDKEK